MNKREIIWIGDDIEDAPKSPWYEWLTGSNAFMSFLASAGIIYVLPWLFFEMIKKPNPGTQQAGFFFTLLLTGVFFVIGELIKPKAETEQQRPSNLGDFRFPTAEEGRTIPLVWGTVRLKGPNVLWYGDLREQAITERVKTGLFSKKNVTTGFRYNVGIQFGLCRGTVDEVTGVWIGEDRVFTGAATSSIAISEPNLFGGNEFGSGGVSGTLRLFLGTQVQTASSYLSPFQQQGGDTPAYRGTCYAVWERGYIGNSSNIKAWSFEVRRLPNPLSLLTATNELNGGNDLNPVTVIYELLTNDEWGLGIDPGDIDTSDFSTNATTLATELNGFSMSLERSMDALQLLREVERQIDGVAYIDRTTGLWKINLVRPGATSLGTIDETNVISIRNFSRATWEDTSNQVRVKYSSRNKEYKETYALSQNMANLQIVGQNNTADANYPGVKDDTLANVIAWRDERTLSRPLAKATLVVDRTFWNAQVGDLVEWSDANLGIVSLDMRVLKVDLGNLVNGAITLQLVEDIFTTDAPSFVEPQPTGWVPPVDTVVNIPLAERAVFEAPKAFSDRDPDNPGIPNRIWAGARSQGNNEIQFDVEVAGNTEGTTVGFLLIGELNASVARGVDNSTIVLNSNIDSAVTMAAEFSNVTDTDKGVSLAQLIWMNGEFMFVDSASENAGLLTMNTVTRGVLDSTPQAHTAGDSCFLLFVAGNISDGTFTTDPSTDLLPESPTSKLLPGDSTNQVISMQNRDLRPYPPARLSIGLSLFPTGSISLDTNTGSGVDDSQGFTVDWTRRDFRTTDEFLSQFSEASLPGDYPAANTTEHRIEVIDDPDGTPTPLFHTAWVSSDGVPINISRTEILANNAGVVPSRLGLSVETRHTVDGDLYTSLEDLDHEFDVASTELTGTNLGVVGNGVPTGAYAVVTTGNHTLRLGAAVLTGGATLQHNVNGGGFVNTGINAATSFVTLAYNNTDSVTYQVTGQAAISTNTLFEVDDLVGGTVSEAHAVFTL